MSTAGQSLPRYTVEDYLRWEGDWELWDGHPIAMSPSPFGWHQEIQARLIQQLRNEIDRQQCDANAVSELDWIVADTTAVRPDVVVICDGIPEAHLRSTPSLVVEILSTSTRQNDEGFKRELYQSQRVATYLIIDPDAQAVRVNRLNSAGTYDEDQETETLAIDACDGCQIELDLSKLFR